MDKIVGLRHQLKVQKCNGIPKKLIQIDQQHDSNNASKSPSYSRLHPVTKFLAQL